jgi:hypothetical protein
MIQSSMTPHGSKSWCNLCGERKENLVDIYFAKNAEKDVAIGKGGYIRICADCGKRITAVGEGKARVVMKGTS